ncbi:MAG TPA: CocE/NonD family hydrolase [Terriglobia bacterium]|nr:CocE/NonD family hydrolase [Terriglobia bacterium]
MRDGVKIAVDLSVPGELKAGEKIPTIIRQTRYYRSFDLGPLLRFFTRNWPSAQKVFVARGYAWMDVDVRGTGASFGRWPYPWSPDEIRDGAEVVNWIVRQPWSNGKVGAMGMSYDGGSAEFLLVNRHPAVKAVSTAFSFFDAYTDIAYPGGIPLNSFITVWQNLDRALDTDYLPSIRAFMPRIARSSYRGVRPVDSDVDRSMLGQAIREHDYNLDVAAMARQITYRDDAPWPPGVSIDAFSPFAHASEISASGTAMVLVDGWFDAAFQNAAINCYLTLKNPVRLILGPWNHGGWNDASPFSRSWRSAFDLNAELLRFFDYQLGGGDDGTSSEQSVLYFTMGEEKWKSAVRWPPPGTHTVSLYLDQGHRLSREKPTAAEASDGYVVDLTHGTGRTSRWDLGAQVIYPDRRQADEKLLCYTSAPLEADTEVTGHPAVTLFVSSTAADAEFFSYLEDVDPQGRVAYVTEGELRGIDRRLGGGPPPYRQLGVWHSFQRRNSMPLVPGEITEVQFAILPTSYLFKRGHSIRLALAGADKDHFALPSGPVPTLKFYRDSSHASRVELPVMKKESGDRSQEPE